MVKCFLLPGLFNSGPQHWQTHWENKYGFTRIIQHDWETPDCREWTETIEREVLKQEKDNEIILIGHSLACCTIVHWAKKFQHVIKGALIVAPSDVEAPNYPPGTTGFAPMPFYKLPFPSIVVASTDDEYVSLDRATTFASEWGSEFINAGALGHINSSSSLGDWDFGYRQLQKLIVNDSSA